MVFVGVGSAVAFACAHEPEPAPPPPPPTTLEIGPSPETIRDAGAPAKTAIASADPGSTGGAEAGIASVDAGATRLQALIDRAQAQGLSPLWGEGLDAGGLVAIGTVSHVPRADGGVPLGRLGTATGPRPPRVLLNKPSVNGKLAPEIVHRIIRRHLPRFRYCYERGLKKSRLLGGRAEFHFVIGPRGRVVSVRGGLSSLPDAEVLGCARRAFAVMVFPQPESGTVDVDSALGFVPPPRGEP